MTDVLIQIPKMDRLRVLFQDTFHHAADSLSQLVSRSMIVNQFHIDLFTPEAFLSQIQDRYDDSYFASILKVHSDLRADVVFLIPESEGFELYGILAGETVSVLSPVTEEMIATLGELNNILGSAFINCLANALGRAIHSETPLNTFDMLGAILQSVALQDEFINIKVLCADATLAESSGKGFSVRLLILSDKDQLIDTV